MTSYPVTVDGFDLSTLAYRVESVEGQWGMAGRRDRSQTIPGVHGVAASYNDDFAAAEFALKMWVHDVDPNTGVLGSGKTEQQQFRENLDRLKLLFGKNHAPLDIRQQVTSGNEWRQALCKAGDPITPNLRDSALYVADLTVPLTIPDVFWRDPDPQVFSMTSITVGASIEVTTLAGGTASVDDAQIVIGGPFTNPRVTDLIGGGWVQYNGVLGSTIDWRLDAATWASRTGAGIGLSGAGSDARTATVYNRAAGPRYLRLVPEPTFDSSRYRISVTGTGSTSASRVRVQAHRKFH